MSRATDRTLHPHATLLRFPGEDRQRAAKVIPSGMGHEAPAVAWARAQYPGVPLGWLCHESGAIEYLPEPEEAKAA